VRAFVVPDAHGNVGLVHGLLRSQGIADELGRLDRDTMVIQLGDLCNCVASSVQDDLRCLRMAEKWFDVYLVGNHEHPYFTITVGFSGFFRDPEIREHLLRLDARGLIRPCIAIDGVLVSHSGLSSYWGRHFKTAAAAEARLRELWREDKGNPVFDACGQSRGGWYAEGGILWSDWAERKCSAFPQLVGHTVGDEIRRKQSRGNEAMCIDLGAGKKQSRIAGAWLVDGVIETVVYEQTEAVTPDGRDPRVRTYNQKWYGPDWWAATCVACGQALTKYDHSEQQAHDGAVAELDRADGRGHKCPKG